MDSPVELPLHLPDLTANGWEALDFAPFREGVRICTLRAGEPAVALLRYAPGASVPRHLHLGLETILVLEGVQSDERGDYPKGSLVLNPEGSAHSVWTEGGCLVLVQWDRPVRFLEEEEA